MKDELIKYVMEKADQCYSDDFPIYSIQTWIREFFDQYQPERSKREDAIKECQEMGHVNTWMPKDQTLCMRCGALTSMET